ncbi:elongation factor [Babesia ovis]|uniref:Elongation factor n=1 Tax=Babesia ovis TaxID=5869 RepID=A0A9W5TED5_BABOV|nr:elongation factor [Babesia ovis]
MTLNLPIGAKVDKVELEKHSALVQYLDEDARELVVSDQNFEEKRIPSSIIGDGVKLLEAGDELQLFYHNETIVKISLPNTINSRLKKK